MTSRKVLVLMAALAILAMNSVANAGIVDPANSSATIATGGTMTIAPGGADSFLTPINRRIDVYVNDSGNNPVEIIASDIWLSDPTVSWCPGGVIADSSTFHPDAGHTTFTGTPRGGIANPGINCGTISIDVVAVGNIIESLNLSANSPDLTGNGTVDVADFGLFAGFFGVLDVDGDTACANYDEMPTNPQVNVADFGIFAQFFNASNCP
jgi:hypothetical protein